MKEKKEAAFRALNTVGYAIEEIKHGRTNHVSITDHIWPQLILSLVSDFGLTTYTDIYRDVDIYAEGDIKPKIVVKKEYVLFSSEEGKTMDSLFGMGRVLIGGASHEGISHSSTMRNTDVETIERFRIFAQRYVENYRFKKRKTERMSHAQS
jgi:hypothetical protein